MKDRCLIKKDDKVKVITGKDKGKIGKVLRVIEKKNRLLVENINMVKRHSRPSAKNKQGGIIEGEAAIHWSNVMLMCNKCITPVRIKTQHLEDGKKIRVCGKCSEAIDK
ncbi:MAG: 50S ribosomal protein L24 [Desulfobacterales bacterium]|nr:50S ribosomal protein L24 [Deltaproteobacteria bacterium]NNL41207.1 50S ribosomal protein L24 [Desulfobacterales bacterium]